MKTVVRAILYDIGFVSTDVQAGAQVDETWLDVEVVVTVVEGFNEGFNEVVEEVVSDVVLDTELVRGPW